jgi:hypothetical protein
MLPLRAAELHALGALDRALLHVFIAGPGYGEGLAIALPHAGGANAHGGVEPSSCRAAGARRA